MTEPSIKSAGESFIHVFFTTGELTPPVLTLYIEKKWPTWVNDVWKGISTFTDIGWFLEERTRPQKYNENWSTFW